MVEKNHTLHSSKQRIDVLFVIALEEEFEIFNDTFSGIKLAGLQNGLDIRPHTIEYFQYGNLECRTVVIGDQGPEAATSVMARVLEQYLPALVINLGISGRIDSDFGLGDVVVATDVDNPFFRAKAKNGKIFFAGKSFPLSNLAIPLLAKFRTSPPTLSLASALSENEINVLQKGKLIHGDSKVQQGPIFASTFLVDDAEFAKGIVTGRNRLLGAADMESGAIVSECWKAGIVDGNILVIRGISDPANGDKKDIDKIQNGILRRIAMKNATALVWHAFNFIKFDNDKPQIVFDDNSGSLTLATDVVIDLLNRFENEIDSGMSVEDICENFNNAAETNATFKIALPEMCRSAYEEDIQKVHSKSNIIRNINRTGRDYLVALYVMNSLELTIETKLEGERYHPLEYVYPQRVNRFCKAIMFIKHDEKELVDRLINSYLSDSHVGKQNKIKNESRTISGVLGLNVVGSQRRAHVCYLLGRLQQDQQRAKAIRHLERWLDDLLTPKLDGYQVSENRISLTRRLTGMTSSQDRMLLRTILISLVMLGRTRHSEDYIKVCLRDQKFDELNRGFHLEYYGDIEYDPREPMNHIDDLRDCDRTFDHLIRKIKNSINGGTDYPLRSIELQTLLSLCQHRHVAHKLSIHQANQIVDLLSNSSVVDLSDSVQLRGYALMISEHLSTKLYPGQLMLDAYRLKKIPRSGWNAKKEKQFERFVETPESIMEHMAAGMMMIQLYLPEKLSFDDQQNFGKENASAYSKNKILRMFLIHDWAEAYTGDLLPWERSDETKAREEMIMSKIDNFSTYEGVEMAGTYSLWKEFESGTTVNAKIAKDIDLLENLQQLEIENKNPSTKIPDYAEWKSGLQSNLRTSIGKRIALKILSVR